MSQQVMKPREVPLGGLRALTVRRTLPARVPFEEEILMWWNFVGRSHEEIERFRAEWEAESDRFGKVPGYVGQVDRIPAPALPGVRLRPRNRRGKRTA